MSRPDGYSGATWRVHATGAVVVVAIAAALHVLWLQPVRRQAAEIEQVSREITRLEDGLETARRSRLALAGRYASVRGELADVQLELQPTDALNRRMADIVALAGATGLDVSESRAGEATRGRWFDTVPIRIQGRGRFSDGLVFLEQLFTELSDVDVTGFDLSRTGDDAAGRGTFRLDLAWYAAPAASAIADASDDG